MSPSVKRVPARHDEIVIHLIPELPGLRHSTTEVSDGSVSIHTEALSAVDCVGDQPVLFLSEAEEPSSRWPIELLSSLASRTGGSIWFDTRDVGRSSWVDEPYDLIDLMADALSVLDAYEVEAAHLVGRGMGGQIAQQLALAMPDRVASLTLISSTPGRREEHGEPEQWLVDKMTKRLFADPPSEPGDLAEWITEQLEWFNGPVFPFDREAALARAAAEVEQGWRGPNAHGAAVVGAPDIVDHLGNLKAPALVVHGTSDPVYPVAHGQGISDRIPNAQLVLIEGMGHELPVSFIPQLVDLFERHLLA